MAKPGIMKKYMKLAKGNFKKAWKLQKAAKKGGATKKATKKKTTKKKTTKKKTGGSKMAKAKSTMKKAAQAIRYKFRNKKLEPVDLLIRTLIGAGGGMTTSFIINKTPMVKNWNPFIKSFVQMGLGVGSVLLMPKKWDLPRYLGVGSFTAGTYGLVRKITKQEVLAGDADLTEAEVQALLSAGFLNGPQTMALNGPAKMTSLNGPQKMGNTQPDMMGYATPSMMGTGFRY